MSRPQIDFLKYKTQNVISIMVVGFIILLGICLLFKEIPPGNKEIFSQILTVLSPIVIAITVTSYGGAKKEQKTE